MPKPRRKLYRVRFHERTEKNPITTVVVEHMGPSEHIGLICLEHFVFFDQTKLVMLPEEDEIRKRFSKVEKLHLPIHAFLSVEEFFEEEPDLKHLPFVREVTPPENA